MPIRVLLVDDHTVVREGLRALLALETDLEVVGEAANGREGVALAVRLKPDVVVMDIGMDNLNGFEATRQIRRDVAQAKVVVLSMHVDEAYVLAALDAGAAAYVVKDAGTDEVLQAIRAVSSNRHYLSPVVAGHVMSAYANRGEGGAASALSLLTDREREVLQLVAEGHSSAGIAVKLHISAKTVETHRQNLMRKLDLHNIAALTKFAIRHGLTEP